jgi:hypothetical protein
MSKSIKLYTFDEFADELLAERQPRALIILASSQIDSQLRNLIEIFLLPKTAKAKEPDELLEGDTPLSTFSSRIKISIRLGIIDKPIADALNNLRDIRNKAAHWIMFGVSESPLREKLKALDGLIKQRRSYQLTVSKFFTDEQLNELQSLQATLLTLSVLLASIKTKIIGRSLPKIHKPLTLD